MLGILISLAIIGAFVYFASKSAKKKKAAPKNPGSTRPGGRPKPTGPTRRK